MATSGGSCDKSTPGVTQTKIVVLMDEAEERRPSKQRVSSIPLLRHLNLRSCDIHTVRTNRAVPLTDLLRWVDLSSPHTALLYPSESSTPLSVPSSTDTTRRSDTCQPLPSGVKSQTYGLAIDTLIVLDGSWRTVQQILHCNSCLHFPRMRHVRLDLASYTSYYQRLGLRQEPAANCVSTAEAIALALLILESPDNRVGSLILTAFQEFVQRSSSSDPLSLEDVSAFDCSGELGDIDGSESTSSKKRKLESCDGGEHETAQLLLRAKGVGQKTRMTKAQKRKCHRKKEHRRKK